MEENYLCAKQHVIDRYGSNCPYFPYFVLALYAMLSKYPNNQDLVLQLFHDMDIFFEDDTILNIMERHNLLDEDFKNEEERFDSSICETYGVSSPGYTVSVSDGVGSVQFCSPAIACSVQHTSPSVLLNVFIHEFNHLIKGLNHGISYYQTDDCFSYSTRSGLNQYVCRYYPEQEMVEEVDAHNILDEAINTIQTTEMMRLILSLDGIVPDGNVQSLLDSFDRVVAEQDIGYDSAVELIRPLWEIDSFRHLVEKHLLDGQIDTIIEDFDSKVGEGAFEDLADSLDLVDEFDSIRVRGKKMEKLKNHIRKMIKMYQSEIKKYYKC